MIMNNLVFLPKNTHIFCIGIFLSKWNELYDAFFFHLCPNLIFPFSIASLYYFFSLTCRYQNNKHKNDSTKSLGLDFERVIYVGEFSTDEGMEDDDLPPDLLRLVAQDEKRILPHQEVTEAINLRTEE